MMSRVLIVHSSTDKQYSGDSYFRKQDFIQTNLHGTLPRILMPVSATLASQEFTQAFPKPCSWCNGSQLMRGSSRAPGNSSRPLAVQVQSCGSLATPSGPREKGHSLKRWLPLRQSLWTVPDSVRSLAFRQQA
jgi:hypothetical protein